MGNIFMYMYMYMHTVLHTIVVELFHGKRLNLSQVSNNRLFW